MSGHVVCVGLATLDSIFALPRHPAADDRVVATELAVAGGGPAATAAVTLARLGADVSFVGVVGDDASGVAIREGLDREGVDVSEVAVVAGGRSPQSSILVEGDSRAIVHYPGNLPRVELSRRALERCRAAAWVHVDHAGYAAAPRDARLSIDGGNPIEDLDLEGVALYGPSDVGLERDFGSADHALSAGAELVVVTRGARGSAAYSRDGVVEAEAVPIESPVSTLGAGDVFHGALLARLLEDAPIAAALAFANTCAALSTRALDGRSAIPTP
ncbi:MAG TPA: PfkB family carbohydrate kinase, partial [Gaiellaceae bacterium]|nr:PfkB family carbohydrate kinase [Gaiellaceae bacterium]